MIRENQAEFEKSNLIVWHNSAYKGQGVTIVVLDDIGLPHKFTNVELPFPSTHKGVSHKTNVCSVAREVAPGARIVALNWFGDRENSAKWIREHKNEIDIVNCSFVTPKGELLNFFYENFIDLNIPFLCGSGNDSKEDKIQYPARYDWTIAVGAWEEYRDKRADYSNGGKELDCVAYTDIYIPTSDGYSRTMKFSGTSCAAPMVSGMLACYLSWRKEKGLPKLSREEVRKFIHNNTIDVLEEGHDYRSGYGLFRLPERIPEVKEVIEVPEFSDVKKNRWSAADIDLVSNLGIMQGLPDGTFAPTKPVTREELATVIARLVKEGYIRK